jgi:hypothetical protein
VLDGPAPPSVRVAPSSRANSWEDVADLSATLGMPLDEWQETALEAAMGERADGRWASKFVGISAPRQNGKSQLIVARALAGILLFGEKTIICSAHQTDTAREVFTRLLDVIEGNPSLERRVTAVMKAVNRESITFGRGLEAQTIKVKARVAAGGRGFSSDCLLLDEAQILGKRQWGSIQPTMSARPNPQLWLFGTPPTPEDDAFAFSRVRESALKKRARYAWLEWSASPKDDFDDPATWAKANPSYGVRISHEACADDRSAMDDEQFALERLGIWTDPDLVRDAAFGEGRWDDCLEAGAEPVVDAIGAAVAWDRQHASIGAAGMVGNKVLVGKVDRREGSGWLIPELLRIQTERQCPVVADGRGPTADLIPAMEAAGIRVTVMSTSDVLDASVSLFDRVQTQNLAHPGHPDLDRAVAVAAKRDVGDTGRWTWARKTSAGDISLLEAVTLAAWAAGANYDVMESAW